MGNETNNKIKAQNTEALKTLGQKITEYRKEAHLTQKELAEKLCVSDKAVSKWERDICCPDINTLPLLSNLFGISVDDLIKLNKGDIIMNTNHSSTEKTKPNFEKTVNLALKAVGVAMGVAVTVLSILGELSVGTGFTLLGIGLFSLAVSSLPKDKDE